MSLKNPQPSPVTPSLIISKLESIITDMECPICLSVIENTHVVPNCGHRFCGDCIKKSLRTCNNECPSCRIPVKTKRSLREDDLFDHLIQKLSCIIQECSDEKDNFNFETLLDSLKALLWHFQCPLCFNELEDTHVSTECLHRVCKGCIVNHYRKKENGECNRNGKKDAEPIVALIDAKGELQLNKNVQCPCCQINTKFVPDKHFENINKAIHSMIELLEGDQTTSDDEEEDDYDNVEGEYDEEGYYDTTNNETAGYGSKSYDQAIPDYMPSEVVSNTTVLEMGSNNGNPEQSSGQTNSNNLLKDAVPDEVMSNVPELAMTEVALDTAPPATNVRNSNNDGVSTFDPIVTTSHDNQTNDNISSDVPSLSEQKSTEPVITHHSMSAKDQGFKCRDDHEHDDHGANYKVAHQPQHENETEAQPPQTTSAEPNSSSFKPPPKQLKVTFNIKMSDIRIKPKYAIGTRFIQIDTEKCGRIVGFDSESRSYKIIFPQDKSCDVWNEDDFLHNKRNIKIIKSHKRPNQTKKIQKRRQSNKNNGDKVLCCPQCNCRFSSNANDEVTGRVPVQSQNCAHVLCLNCIQSLRMDGIANGGGGGVDYASRKLRVTVDCPICTKSKSFNAVKPNICQAMCKMVQLYEDMEQQRKEDRIRKIIEKEEHKLKEEKQKIKESRKRDRSSLTSSSIKKEKSSNDEQRMKSKHRKLQKEEKSETEKHTATSSRNKKEKKKKHKKIMCKSCGKEKVVDKFSSKQIEKCKKHKSKPLCRRCEEKSTVKQKLGRGAEKVCTTVMVAKKHGSKPKFLTTIVPWSNGDAQKQSTPLPPDLTIDGYTRDPWGMMSNSDSKEEECWIKGTFWSTSIGGISQFINFLKEHQKSAYGTFLLPDQTDGFFVIPFDQPSKVRHFPENIIHCKYIFGLGLVGDNQNDNDDGRVGQQQKSMSLRNLIAAEFKSNQALSIVPKGSVQAARKIVSRPEGPVASGGATNWFRQRNVIKEGSDDDSDDDDDNSSISPEDVKVGVNYEADMNICSSIKYDL